MCVRFIRESRGLGNIPDRHVDLSEGTVAQLDLEGILLRFEVIALMGDYSDNPVLILQMFEHCCHFVVPDGDFLFIIV